MFFVVFVFLFRMKSTTGLLKWKLPSLILKGTLILIFIIGLLLHIASFIPFQNSPNDHDFSTRHFGIFQQNTSRHSIFWGVVFVNLQLEYGRNDDLNRLFNNTAILIITFRNGTSSLDFPSTTNNYSEIKGSKGFTRLYRGGAPFSNTAYSEAMQLVKEYQLGNRSNSKLKKINTISKLVEKSGSRRSTDFLLLLAALVSTTNNVLEIGLSKDYTRMLHKLLESTNRLLISTDRNKTYFNQFKGLFSWNHLFIFTPACINRMELLSLRTRGQSVMVKLQQDSTVWISLAVCLDGNVKNMESSRISFDYHLATIWANRLWQLICCTRVIVTVVSSNSTINDHPIVRQLMEDHAIIRHVFPLDGLKCHTTSQVVRMFAFELKQIKPDDIIIMSDADAFPSNVHVLNPLFSQRDAWVWQHIYSEESGFTFPMSLIAMRGYLWKRLMYINNSTNFTDSMQNWKKLQAPVDWGIDQRIITYALLKSNICSPVNKLVWKSVRLKPSIFNDTSTCFHGKNQHRHGDNRQWIHLGKHVTPDGIEKLAKNILNKTGLHYQGMPVQYKIVVK